VQQKEWLKARTVNRKNKAVFVYIQVLRNKYGIGTVKI